MPHRLVDIWLTHRLKWLFVALLGTLGVNPVLEAAGLDIGLTEVFLVCTLAATVAATWRTRASRALTGVVGTTLGLWAVFHLARFGHGPSLGAAALAVGAFCVVGAIVPAVFGPGRVDGERVAGALSAYLLIGFAFGGLFLALALASPGALAGRFSGGGVTIDDTVYFSFVTLATLGYGDIVPIARPARALALLEAVTGQLYLAVLVARLVSLYSAGVDRESGG